jgi:hypothetical protein
MKKNWQINLYSFNMDNSEYSQYMLLIFGLLFYLTFFRVEFKASPPNDPQQAEINFEQFQTSDLYRSMAFLATIICLELMIVYSIMISRCSNISRGILYPILIWVFIFLGTKIILLSAPGFKSAFSDVIGYYFTYGFKQNKFLIDLLDNTKTDPEKSKLIVEIISDKGLLFNTMVPGNFDVIWNDLTANFNPKYLSDADVLQQKKQQLLNWVVQRDIIGEACWLLWSGILCISVISLYTYSFPCELTANQIQQNKANYDKQIQDNENNSSNLQFVTT